jgi:hypothetical protein
MEGRSTRGPFFSEYMQAIRGEHLPWTRAFMAQYPISEDCLYLNVWTAAKEHHVAMELGVKTGMRPIASEEKFQFWKEYLEKP